MTALKVKQPERRSCRACNYYAYEPRNQLYSRHWCCISPAPIERFVLTACRQFATIQEATNE